ncbi:DUF4386 domain-containing protein [Leptospira sp. GIMC2001]|uniref:DUF4386 domain-containing protein n=1 Tax=Leptospira sp. GIMC2001 TaxID=1513297 RepID=UPI00234B8B9D|nr:DUF4386 domain-containing protein [Leptospira sp. GIMC2001]WCL50630.1 DUF4386 domain-containing protein [Leptospira sp. GIMC2001]
MKIRNLSILTGISYIIIFFAAIYANFQVLEDLKNNPVTTVLENSMSVRLGIMAFIITVVFDVVIAWTLLIIYSSHDLSLLSNFFRLIHAVIMAIAVFSLTNILNIREEIEIIQNVQQFDNIWLIGLFFFGIHLVLLSKIFQGPAWIRIMLMLAGIMYLVDTSSHILIENYVDYSAIFLMLVAIPSMLGEMAFAIWTLIYGGRKYSDLKQAE